MRNNRTVDSIPAAAPASRPIRVLVADDSPISRNSICDFLQAHAGLDVVGRAENGCDAIEQVESLRPELVLLDLEMPVLNGLRAAQELRTRFPQLRIVIISVYDSFLWHKASRDSGADEFIPKHQLLLQHAELLARLFKGRNN